jgi:N utilization substance protein B
MKKKKIQSDASPKAKNLTARLAAVQAVYQSLHTGQSLKSALAEFLAYRNPLPTDDQEALVQPDGALLQKILLGVEERRADLDAMVKANIKRENKDVEPLLLSIMLCGVWELVANPEVDAPIIINDYLNVTHSFYEHGEVSLVNGILDAVAKTVRT